MKKSLNQAMRRKQAIELENKWAISSPNGFNITAMKDSIERIRGLSIQNRYTR